MQKDNVSEDDIKEEIEVPNVIGLTVSEAKKILEETGLEMTYEETEEDVSDKTVTSQVPANGIKIYEGTKVVVGY